MEEEEQVSVWGESNNMLSIEWDVKLCLRFRNVSVSRWIFKLLLILTAGYYVFARQTAPLSVSYLTSPNQNVVLNHTYCLSFYYYVAAPRRRPSTFSLLIYVSSDQVCTVPLYICYVICCGQKYLISCNVWLSSLLLTLLTVVGVKRLSASVCLSVCIIAP